MFSRKNCSVLFLPLSLLKGVVPFNEKLDEGHLRWWYLKKDIQVHFSFYVPAPGDRQFLLKPLFTKCCIRPAPGFNLLCSPQPWGWVCTFRAFLEFAFPLVKPPNFLELSTHRLHSPITWLSHPLCIAYFLSLGSFSPLASLDLFDRGSCSTPWLAKSLDFHLENFDTPKCFYDVCFRNHSGKLKRSSSAVSEAGKEAWRCRQAGLGLCLSPTVRQCPTHFKRHLRVMLLLGLPATSIWIVR